MKMNRKKLTDALQKIKPGLSTEKYIDKGAYFLFTGKELITFNDRISISVPFEVEFKCLVPAKEFHDIVSGITTEDISIKFNTDRCLLSIHSSKVKSTLSCLSFDEKKETLGIFNKKDVKWKNVPDDLMRGISLTVFSCSTDMTKPYLTCLSITKDRIVSSDNLRISVYRLKEKMSDDFLLPISAASELLKFKDITRYAVIKGWVLFKDKHGVVFSSRIMEADYPDVNKFFEPFNKCKWISLPKELGKAIALSGLLAEGDYIFDKKIEMEFSRNKVVCRASKEIGEIECVTDIPLGMTLKVLVNPVFFEQIFEHATKMSHSGNFLLFKSESFMHIMLLYAEKKEG